MDPKGNIYGREGNFGGRSHLLIKILILRSDNAIMKGFFNHLPFTTWDFTARRKGRRGCCCSSENCGQMDGGLHFLSPPLWTIPVRENVRCRGQVISTALATSRFADGNITNLISSSQIVRDCNCLVFGQGKALPLSACAEFGRALGSLIFAQCNLQIS